MENPQIQRYDSVVCPARKLGSYAGFTAQSVYIESSAGSLRSHFIALRKSAVLGHEETLDGTRRPDKKRDYG